MQEKPQWLQNFVAFLIDNFTVLLTIAFASYVIYRQEISSLALNTDELLTAVLAVLGLLATSEIVERYRKLSSIHQANRRILSLLESRIMERPSALGFFQKLPGLDTYIDGANQIDLCGVSLTATINKQFSNLRERLKTGANIRILLVDPDSLGLKMSAARSDTPTDTEYFHKRIEATFNDLEYIHKSWLELQQLSDLSRQGSIAIRLMPFAPSFGIISLDVNRPNGYMFVELYPHFRYGLQPTFDLTFQKDGEWYKFFTEQFEQMWANAKPWEPKIASRTEAG